MSFQWDSEFKRCNNGFALQTVIKENTIKNCFTCFIAIVTHLSSPQFAIHDGQVLRFPLIDWTDHTDPHVPESRAFPSLSDWNELKTWEKFSIPQIPAICPRTHCSFRWRHHPDFIGYRKQKLTLPRFSPDRSFQLSEWTLVRQGTAG